MKTTKEAAKHYADGIVDQSINCTIELLKQFAEQDFKKGVEFAQHWILFEDERPKQFEQVLVRCKGKGDIIYLSEYLGYGSGSFTDTSSTVTHWRPIELK